jgi:glucose-6-phosphate-specific signal transduction histidine kinase
MRIRLNLVRPPKKGRMKTHMHKQIFGFLGIVLIICFLGWIDWQTGYELNFFVFYFIPVIIAAWFYGIQLTIAISIMCAFVWFVADKLSGHNYTSNILAIWNTFIRLSSFVIIGLSICKITILLQLEKNKADDLRKALLEIKMLESFLSICSVCKKIRNEEGNWQQLESYISKHSGTEFSHGYCPECAKKALAELD